MTTERIHPKDALATTELWLIEVQSTGIVRELPVQVIREALEHFGARLEDETLRDVLGAYTNKAKADALRHVWSEQWFSDYKSWLDMWIIDYEQKPDNRELPRLKESGSKKSGMIQFLGELTAYAFGALDFEEFKRFTEARLRNGKAWQEDRPEERIRVQIPGASIPKLLSSIPPGFIPAFWTYLENNPGNK